MLFHFQSDEDKISVYLEERTLQLRIHVFVNFNFNLYVESFHPDYRNPIKSRRPEGLSKELQTKCTDAHIVNFFERISGPYLEGDPSLGVCSTDYISRRIVNKFANMEVDPLTSYKKYGTVMMTW